AARDWFFKNFKGIASMQQAQELCPPGSEQNAYFRMVTSYWEMVASMVASGVLNEDLFFQNGRELLLVWERVKDIVPEVRAMFKDPRAWRNLETVGTRYVEFVQREPGAYEAWRALVAGR
ncbi:MAG: hypothetical protein HYZ57_19555, partial [Acidobacteria bacterium]|nr:hypothetical protein [Acidobacteriota bacterium]MBI3282025.1 hypothetical protein [Acidobacteriota bacterium]